MDKNVKFWIPLCLQTIVPYINIKNGLRLTTLNYEGSAGGMDPHGMLIGFRRSESLHKLNYTGYLGDGNSKSHANVVSANPSVYPGKTVTNLECTGHIQKRMYNRC